MKLSKVVTGTAVVALSTLVLSACSSSSSSKNSSSSKASSSKVVKKSSTQKQVAGGPLKDGTYKLNETGYDHGYKVEMAMTVKDGKITLLSMITLIRMANPRPKTPAMKRQ